MTCLEAKDTLSQEHVSRRRLNVIARRIARVHHETIDELHRLGALTTNLAADRHLTALCARLHNEAKNA